MRDKIDIYMGGEKVGIAKPISIPEHIDVIQLKIPDEFEINDCIMRCYMKRKGTTYFRSDEDKTKILKLNYEGEIPMRIGKLIHFQFFH